MISPLSDAHSQEFERRSKSMDQRSASGERMLPMQSMSHSQDPMMNRREPKWYWKFVSIIASVMILGGFLMLGDTFQERQARISNLALGLFSMVIIVLGIITSIVLCIIIRDHQFRAHNIFLPALISCTIGLLNVPYAYIINSPHPANISTVLTATCSAVAMIIYAILYILTTAHIRERTPITADIPAQEAQLPITEETQRWQTSNYYQNYVKNMFPTASYEPATLPYERPTTITEEEKQRQQMLMLLLGQNQPSKPDSSSSTFRIEWQGHEQEPVTPNPFADPKRRQNGGLPPQEMHLTPSTALSRLSKQYNGELRPWDGVWRGVAQQPEQIQRPAMQGRTLSREDRRRQIEMS